MRRIEFLEKLILLISICHIVIIGGNIFDSDGRLPQVELAFKAAQRGTTVIAAKSSSISIMLSWLPQPEDSDVNQRELTTPLKSSKFHKLSE